MSDKQEPVKVEDLDQPAEELTEQQAEDAKGGILIGLLLPAVQPARTTGDAEPPDTLQRKAGGTQTNF